MSIIATYQLVGTYRGTADVCGTTHKTVKRVIERAQAGRERPPRPPRPSNYESVRSLVAAAVTAGKGRISAKRLLPKARVAGCAGSDRNFRRLVAQEKGSYRQQQGRVRRPAVWSPGEHLVIDWGVIAGVHVFAAVLAWSRIRFVRFAADEQQDTTLGLLAECFEVLGGGPKVVLADRMGCLKGGVVAGRVVPSPGIRVDAVAPRADLDAAAARHPQEGEIRDFGADTPLGRPGQPAELAGAYVYLASPADASYVSGTAWNAGFAETACRTTILLDPYHCGIDPRQGVDRTERRIFMSRRLILGSLAAVAVALGSALPAHAHYFHGAVSCSSPAAVSISSKSAGQTWHQKTVGSDTTYRDQGNVSPSSPYRNWYTGNRSVASWGAQAPVLESHSVHCITAA